MNTSIPTVFTFPQKLIQPSELQIETKPLDNRSRIYEFEMKLKVEVHTAQYRKKKVAVRHFMIDEPSPSQLKIFIGYVILLIRSSHPAIQEITGYSIRDTNFFNFSVITPFQTVLLIDILPKNNKYHIHLTPDEKTIIAYGIARAMLFLEKQGIVNCDLKPQNIAIDEDRYPILMDIGLPKVRKNLEGPGAEYSTYVDITYTAPEVFSSNVFTERSDIFSYGFILGSLLDEVVPAIENPGATREHFIHLVTQHQVKPKILTKANSPITDLIRKCWNTLPHHRPTFDVICRDFENDKIFFEGTIQTKQGKFYQYKQKLLSAESHSVAEKSEWKKARAAISHQDPLFFDLGMYVSRNPLIPIGNPYYSPSIGPRETVLFPFRENPQKIRGLLAEMAQIGSLTAAFIVATDPSFHFQDENQRYEIIKLLAKKGDRNAIFELGKIRFEQEKQDPESDFPKSKRLFERALNKKHPDAAYHLGKCYLQEGTDLESALKFFKIAFEKYHDPLAKKAYQELYDCIGN